MHNSTDSRILKTRRALIGALLSILSEKSYTEFTVNELCDKAGIRRATFYKHFKDKDDFLYFVVRELRERFDATVWKKSTPDKDKDYYISYAEGLVSFLWNHRDITKNILADNHSGNIIGMLIFQNLQDTKRKLDQSVKDGMILGASTDTVAGILTGGVGVLVINWFAEGCQYPKERLIDEIKKAIERVLG